MRWITLTGALVVLAGCSFMKDDKGMFVDRRDDYLDAEQLPPLWLPEDLAAGELRDPFPIPDTPAQSNPQFYPGRPPLPNALYADDTRREVRIQRLGDRRWLVVPDPPTTVWPKLKQFLAENGVQVVREQPQIGRLDSGWFEVSETTEYRDLVRLLLQEGRRDVGLTSGEDRLRFRLEQGLQPETSEIHLRYENDFLAPPTSPDLVSFAGVNSAVPQIEDALLNEVGAYIASRVSEQTVSKVASNIASEAKATLDRNQAGEPVLRLRLDQERAWAAVVRALENGSVEVLDSQPENALFNIHVTEALFSGEEEPGFFGRLFGRGRSGEHDLQLRLTGASEALELSVHELDGGYAEQQLSRDVLSLVREFAG